MALNIQCIANSLILNYYADCHKVWKSGLITCLLQKAKLICWSIMLFNIVIQNLRRMFLQNGSPNYFCDLTLKKLKNVAKQKSRMIRIFHTELALCILEIHYINLAVT